MSDMDRAAPRDDGYIALKRVELGDIITPDVHGRHYDFKVEVGIALDWVHPDDVNDVLKIKCGCCGGHQCFIPANESDVRRWTNRGGR